MLGAEAPPSASGLARDLGIRRATVAKMIRRIRSVLRANGEEAELLYGVVDGGMRARSRPVRRSPRRGRRSE
jgi:hypothetical protein